MCSLESICTPRSLMHSVSSNQGFTYSVIKKQQVSFPKKGDKFSLLDAELHKIRDAPSTKTIYISLY
jgi:hypothetical protein